MTKDRLLLAYTGQNSAYWVHRVQALILLSGDWENEIHPECNVRQWVGQLAHEVVTCVENNRKGSYDENMGCAVALAIILTTWSARIARAKAHDPRRPITLRKKALKRARKITMAMHDAMFDETQDADYFEQPWEYPYMENATNGEFV